MSDTEIVLDGRTFRRHTSRNGTVGWKEMGEFIDITFTTDPKQTSEEFRTLACALDEIERLRAQEAAVRGAIVRYPDSSYELSDEEYGYIRGREAVIEDVEEALK